MSRYTSTHHENTPEDDQTDNGDGWRWRRESLSESCKDDEDQLETIHLLTSNDIGEVSKTQLPENGSTRCSDLDGGIGVGWDGSVGFLVLEEGNTQHGRDQVDSEDLTSISL